MNRPSIAARWISRDEIRTTERFARGEPWPARRTPPPPKHVRPSATDRLADALRKEWEIARQ